MVSKKANYALGSVTAQLFDELRRRNRLIFTVSDTMDILDKTAEQARKMLARLVKRDSLIRLHAGLYMIPLPGQDATQLSNWLLLARELSSNRDYILSHYSAMRLHGLTTHKRRSSISIGELEYHFIQSKDAMVWGQQTHWISKTENVLITDLERTLLDGLANPQYCGGIKEVVRGLWLSRRQLNCTKLVEYTKQFSSKAVIKRLGFYLEILAIKNDVLPQLREQIILANDYVNADPQGKKYGSYVKRWHLRINVNINELKASIWE